MSERDARIHALNATLANQIAAGEVVERPASVLKELLENSLDANARRIRVEVDGGGAARLRVTDDGDGIVAQDLLLALERHATSKIATLDELESVASMGFRGEALPSIASVSRLRLQSRARDADAAWEVAAEGGPPGAAPAPTAHPQGTTVSVRDLFFNTPVRRRFLRTGRTEFRHLDRVFRRLALTAFPVTMTLVHDGREVLRLPAASGADARRRRVARLLGVPFADAALEVAHAAGGLRAWGWLGAPGQARERSDLQHLYVNGRAVVDASVRHAVRLGYGDALAQGLQPQWLLYLELDPRDVDVNVHPSKQEVRFREARMVHDFVRSAVRAALVNGAGRLPVPDPIAPASAAREHRAPYPSRRQPGSAAPETRVLAVQADGVVVVQHAGEILLARAADLRRRHASNSLHAAAGGAVAISRPLLLPERIGLPPGRYLGDDAARVLEQLGFELRRSGEDGVLLLAVPEALAGVAVNALADVLTRASNAVGDAAAWVDSLSRLAADAPLVDAQEALRLWQLLAASGDPVCQVKLDRAAMDRLLPDEV